MVYEILHYLSPTGHNVFEEWLESLRDARTEARIVARIARLEVGNFGDCKTIREGVCELRIDFGPGYRVYYAMAGRRVVLLLCGGDKGTQHHDIRRAVAYWNDFQKRTAQS